MSGRAVAGNQAPPEPQSAEISVAGAPFLGDEEATVAIIDGEFRVGLDAAGLETLARAGADAVKCSRRDIPFLLQSGATAGTTVAATMIAARGAGGKPARWPCRRSGGHRRGRCLSEPGARRVGRLW